MVKITNPLGDVKLGRQGEAVYQRKYGQQIRRMAAPKRAIPSQRQIAHRQLYRAALDWRSGLSLPNRRYLDGYCIANGIVDSYHIPLPWSRFALKLYLEKVRFVGEKPTIEESYEEKTYESYTTGDDGQGEFRADRWAAQTFTPTEAHKIITVKLKLWRYGSPGTLTVGIRATDGEGHPTGADLCLGSIDGNSLTPSAPGAWYQITLGAGADLSASVKYAIVCRAPSGDAVNSVQWRLDTTSPTYAGGNYEYSFNSGSTWSTNTALDFMFEEIGSKTVWVSVPTTWHVRHPALLIVVHKRGDLIINGYDTLSSLDEEYLTGQVGLDVISGDLIEATTLCGISYSHPIL